jgi:putative Mg2+ transporter-C (MgtC) family protein
MEEFTRTLIDYVAPLVAATIAGAMVGLEREYRGRPAGLRTHVLVSLASALLMLAATHQVHWMSDTPYDVIRIDPVRMAHGILTGIGFLCGGVIFRHGLTVHGLTTAASLWVTSALGTLYGVGFYGLAIGGTIVTVLVLSGFRLLDERMPHISLIDVAVRYRRETASPEAEFRQLISDLGLKAAAISHRLLHKGEVIELGATLRGRSPHDAQALSTRLCADPRVFEFEVLPRKD